MTEQSMYYSYLRSGREGVTSVTPIMKDGSVTLMVSCPLQSLKVVQ